MPDLTPGVAFALSPLVRRIVTSEEVNTYLVGIDEVAVIDPGRPEPAHLDAIMGCGGDRIRWVLATHGHPRHAEALGAVAERAGAEVLRYGPGGLAEGHGVEATEFRLAALHTPGHSADHVCFLLEEERVLFSGDHLGGAAPPVAPPEGDLAAWLVQTERLAKLRLRSIAPGHGDLHDDPKAVTAAALEAVARREEAVAGAVATAGQATVDELVRALGADLPDWDPGTARLALWAHLVKLAAEGRVRGDGLDGVWSAA